MKKFCLLIILLYSYHINAQTTFQKISSVFSGLSNLTSDDGCIRTGSIGTVNNIGDIYIVKADSLGNTEWFKIYDSIYNYAVSRSIIQTKDKGFAVTGTIANYDTASHTGGVFLMKTDDTSKVLWLRCYGKSNEEARSVIQTSDNGFIIVGEFSLGSICIFKTDSIGTVIWTKTYDDTVSYYHLGRFIRETKDGGYVIAGDAPIGMPANDFLLMKIDSVGNFLWSKAYGGNYSDRLYAFDVANNGFIMGGDSHSFNSLHSSDAYIIKTDEAGNLIWANTYSKPMAYSAYIYFIMQTKDGGYIACINADTTNTHDIELLKIDSSGNMEWNKIIGQPTLNETGIMAAQTKDGGYMISGNANYHISPFILNCAYLVKTDSLGNAGCYTDTFNLTVTNAPPVITPINFTLFGTLDSSSSLTPSVSYYTATDSTLCFNDGSNAVHEIPVLQKDVSVFPNPATGIINIEANSIIDFVKITNAMGITVYFSNPKTEKTSINLSHIARGIYFYTVQIGGRRERGKILLE